MLIFLVELKALIQLHDKSKRENGPLNRETAELVHNALSMQEKTVEEIMTLVGHLILPASTKLTRNYIASCMSQGKYTLLVSDDTIEEPTIIGALDVKVMSKISL